MLKLGNKNVYCGDIHTHWSIDPLNPSLFLALLNYWDIDFVLLNSPDGWQPLYTDEFSKKHNCNTRFFTGKELQFDWAHICLWLKEPYPKFKVSNTPEETLKHLKDVSHLVVFAHPQANDFNKVKEYYKKGLIDAVELPGTPKWREWYRQCEIDGINIPIVGGMDIHFLVSASEYENKKVFYQDDMSPKLNVACLGGRFFMAMADSCTPDDLIRAIKKGETVIADLDNMELLGREDLKEIVVKNKLIEQLIERQNIRKKVKLELLDKCASSLSIKLSDEFKSSKICFSDSIGKIKCMSSKSNKTKIKLGYPQLLTERNIRVGNKNIKVINPPVSRNTEDYNIITVENNKGLKKVFAVKSSWPLDIKITPKVRILDNKYVNTIVVSIKNISDKVMNSDISISGNFWKKEIRLKLNKLNPGAFQQFDVDTMFLKNPTKEEIVKIKCKLSDGSMLVMEKEIGFAVALYLNGGNPWKKHDYTICIDSAERLDTPFSNYRGSEDISADVNLWWDENNFYIYAEVKDDVYYNKATSVFSNRVPGADLYLNDSIEIGIDPLNLKEEQFGNVYNITYGLSNKNVPEVVAFASPCLNPKQKGSGWHTDKCLEKSTLLVERDETNKITLYKLTIPWFDIYPLYPLPNASFGFSILINDNDGDGYGRKFIWWGGSTSKKKPSDWGIVTFIDK